MNNEHAAGALITSKKADACVRFVEEISSESWNYCRRKEARVFVLQL